MKKSLFFLILICLGLSKIYSQKSGLWGDQGNGTFINPVLNADYSDPDVIRVGKKYYMVCSEFHYMGMTIQESEDMVNWKIVGRVYEGLNFPEYNDMKRYASGSWAPSIRFNKGKFYVYFCTPDEGLFMTSTVNPEGPWEPLHQVKAIKGWEDPCPFWDEDGNAYLGRSAVGAGPIIMHRMSEDGKNLLDEGRTVYTGKVAEGTKIYKKNGFYYLSIPEGGVAVGWQTVLRSKNIYGPYERKVVLEQGLSKINGPHQGALVETPGGEWWFYHFQMVRGIGRVMHLEPVNWTEDWPKIGDDRDANGIGEPVYVWKKPDVGKNFPVVTPQSTDEFSKTDLGLQWQWNHNPDDNNWSLKNRSGWLTLNALKATNLKLARNTVTQKIIGYSGEIITKLDGSKMKPGQRAGLTSLSNVYNAIGLVNIDGKLMLYFDKDGKENITTVIKKEVVYLKFQYNTAKESGHFSYSLNNENFQDFGTDFKLLYRDWKGSKIGLFSYNEAGNDGIAAFDFFHYEFDGPGDDKKRQN